MYYMSTIDHIYRNDIRTYMVHLHRTHYTNLIVNFIIMSSFGFYGQLMSYRFLSFKNVFYKHS